MTEKVKLKGIACYIVAVTLAEEWSNVIYVSLCLQCLNAVGWSACKKLSGGMLAWLCLGQGADLHMATAAHYLLLQ